MKEEYNRMVGREKRIIAMLGSIPQCRQDRIVVHHHVARNISSQAVRSHQVCG